MRKAPEFIRDLAKFLNMPEIVNKYNDSSNCYRLTYRVPLEQVIIDNKDDYEIEKKTFQLLFLIFERYFETIRNKKRYVKIFTNPLLRIKEGLSIDDNSLICKTMLE